MWYFFDNLDSELFINFFLEVFIDFIKLLDLAAFTNTFFDFLIFFASFEICQ